MYGRCYVVYCCCLIVYLRPAAVSNPELHASLRGHHVLRPSGDPSDGGLRVGDRGEGRPPVCGTAANAVGLILPDAILYILRI